MREKVKYSAAAIMCTLIFTGCGAGESADTYIEGTDYPYQHYNRSLYGIGTVEGNDSVYFKNGHYIYQLDEETDILTPLCNKTNCLHTQETDNSRMKECNAYIPQEDATITYMDGYVYSVVTDWSGNQLCDGLYKIAEDGSTKETIYQWEGQLVEAWCIHRDVLYYVEHTFDADNQEYYAVKAMKLSGMGKLQPETIFESEKGIVVYAFGELKAYGNHLYINLDGVSTDEIDYFTEEDFLKYSYNRTFQYNLQDKSITEIRIPDQTETQKVSEVTFWKDKIIYAAMDIARSHEYDAESDVYIADLDGTNATVLLEDMPAYRWYSSDGTYLYVSNCPECLDKIFHNEDYHTQLNEETDQEPEYDFTLSIDIYDRDMNLVDTVQAPYHSFPVEPAYGSGDRMYIQMTGESGDTFAIEYWDKTKIGTYHGEEYQLTRVCEQPIK